MKMCTFAPFCVGNSFISKFQNPEYEKQTFWGTMVILYIFYNIGN